MIALLLALHLASYAAQRSSGVPLNDTANVRSLARFDLCTVEATPWAKDVNGLPRTDALMRLRAINPNIKIALYLLVGDQWLPPTFVPGSWDHSAYRDVFDAVNKTGGWLYDTDGRQYFENYRVNLGNAATVEALGDVYVRLIQTHLFDMAFLDCAHTSIAWTSGSGGRALDYERAGFRSLRDCDSARAANMKRLIDRLHAAGGCGFQVALNGTGPKPPNLDIDFREGVASGLVSPEEAMRFVESPGTHWIHGEAWTPEQGAYMSKVLRGIASHGSDVIVSLGPNRDWSPVLP